MHQLPAPQQNMAQRFARYFVRVLTDSDFEYTESQSPVAKVLWGVWLLNPRWDTFSGSRAYETMAHVAPESGWGLVFLIAGIVHLIAIVLGHHRARLVMALGGVFVWVSVAAMFAQAAIASTGVPVYALLGLGAGWSFWRLLAKADSDDE